MTQSTDKARLKQKILGVRMRTARTQRGLEISQIAQQMGISADLLESYEEGKAETSLPELEALAQICFVPVTYFWANGQTNEANLERRISIRRKMLGVQLAQARQNANLSAAELAQAIHLTETDITAYEYGQKTIPLGKLEAIATHLALSLDHFLETMPMVVPAPVAQPSPKVSVAPKMVETSPAPVTQPMQQSANSANDLAADEDWLVHLPDDAKEFLSDPANVLYLKLSMRLQGLSTDTLRSLAEGILDITY